MDRYLHLQGRAGRHGGGTRLGLSALVHHSIFERPYCATRIARKMLRRVFFAAGARSRGLTCGGTKYPAQFRDMNKFAIGCGAVLVIILFVALIIGLSFRSTYNRLVTLDQDVNKKWGDVQSVYQRRADLIPNLVNTVSGAAKFEKSTLVEVTNARASVGRVQLDPNRTPTDAKQLEEFQAAQGQLSNALSRLLVVVERYPELKSNQNFLGLQAQLEGTENRISVERGNFNTAVQNYNIGVRSLPTNLIAGMLGVG